MRLPLRLAAALVTLLALVAIPASAAMASRSGASAHRASSGSASAAASGTTVIAQRSRYGTVLFDGRHRALYLFTRDKAGGAPRCYGACARAWPPLLTRGTPRAGSGARSSLVGSLGRSDGTRQVTYKGQPLYRYTPDGVNQILCQDVFEFGGRWLVVSPGGSAVT